MSTFLLLTSPPASGKTYFLKNFFKELDSRPLVISPLRALANEMKQNWQDEVEVMTPEEFLLNPKVFQCVIFDEIHLWFYWGDSFRHRMWEAFFEICSHADFVLGLSATITSEMKKEITNFESHFNEMFWIDFGNQKLKYRPQKYVKTNKNFLAQLIRLRPKSGGVRLIFCQFRSEVFELTEELRKMGQNVWCCVGGEAQEFSLKVQNSSPPEVIVATTVLSHGVNLPMISEIYFTYPVNNIDFWIQMVARGGRRGEKFEVYSLEGPHDLAWNFYSNFLAIGRLRLRIRFHNICEQIEEWFLKVS